MRLEEELGVPLFERKSHGVVLNQYGEIFLRHVNRALWEIDEAKQEINNLVDPSHGTISLAFIQPLGSSYIPDFLCEVANEPFVLYKSETSLHDIVEELCHYAGFHPKMSFEAFEERTVAGLVGAKFGIALIPFVPGLDKEKVSLIHVRDPRCLLKIQMVCRSDGYVSPALIHFKSYVENSISFNK